MAKRKKDDGGGVWLVWLGVGLMVFAIIEPIIAIVGWLFYEFMCHDLPKSPSSEDFELNCDEEKEIASLRARLAQQKIEYEKWERDGRGLPRRQDGRFDERNPTGRELNDWLERFKPINQEAHQAFKALEALPDERLGSWAFNMSGRFAFRSAVLAYVILFLGLNAWQPEGLGNLAHAVTLFTVIPIFPKDSPLWGAAIWAAAGSLLLVPPLWWFNNDSLKSAVVAPKKAEKIARSPTQLEDLKKIEHQPKDNHPANSPAIEELPSPSAPKSRRRQAPI